MAMILTLVGLVVVALVILGVVRYASERSLGYKRKYLNELEQRKIAEKALRNIRNDSGAPVLEAQIALDDIERLRTKELN